MRFSRFILMLSAVTSSAVSLEAQDPGYTLGPDGAIVAVDTSIYADIATAELVILARARHRGTALKIQGYDAQLFTRLEGRISTSRFDRGFKMFGYETAAQVWWEQPSDVRVDVKGIRSSAARLPGLRRESWTTWWSEIFSDQLWFSPAALGDDIHLMGLPDEEAIHPLARDAHGVYRYAIDDSVRMDMPDRSVVAVSIHVEPRTERPVVERMRSDRRGPTVEYLNENGERVVVRTGREGRRTYEPSMVSGQMWLDADSLDVIRMTVAFVGENVWDEDDDAPDLISVEADLEYALFDQAHWLPARQTLAATFRFKYMPGALLPATAVTTFSDYNIRTSPIDVLSPSLFSDDVWDHDDGWSCPEPWDFDERDDLECARRPFVKTSIEDDGTRVEFHVPSLDSLLNFDFGPEFEHTEALASEDFIRDRISGMAHITEGLPTQWQTPDAPIWDWQQWAEVFRFNRVQGVSVGTRLTFPTPLAFTTADVEARMGTADLHPILRLTYRRDAPGSDINIDAYHRLRDIEPWTRGTGLGNSLKALFAGHDDADYYRATGAMVTVTARTGSLRGYTFSLGAERMRSVTRESGSILNDVFFGNGTFQLNPAIAEGDFLLGGIERVSHVGNAEFRLGTRALAGQDTVSGVAWASAAIPFFHEQLLGLTRLRAATTWGDTLNQTNLRAGGPETVRGFVYGARRGRTLWSVQTDLEWEVNRWWSPIAFVDVGNVGEWTNPLVGAGLGVSVLSGWLRLELAKGISPVRTVRADLLVTIPVN